MSQGMGSVGRTTQRGTADKLKERFQWLESFSDDELSQMGFCSEGVSLSSDEVYFDISHPERGIIPGNENETVPEGSCYVPKSEVNRQLWDRLVGPYS